MNALLHVKWNWLKSKIAQLTPSYIPGLAVGRDEFEAVEFEGTIYVNSNCKQYPQHSQHCDDDFLGVVFAFQVISWDIIPQQSLIDI